jgi:phage tail-like protein
MSCRRIEPTFRLLDGYVGWDEHSIKHLSGFDGTEGIQLDLVTPGAIDPSALLAYLSPPRLARACGPCEWYLITPYPPKSRLLRYNSCSESWQPAWSEDCFPEFLEDPVAVTTRRHRVAISDPGADAVFVWTRGGEQLIARITIENPGPLTFTPWGELLVASSDRIVRISPDGYMLGELTAQLRNREVDRIGVAKDCSIWIITRENNGNHRLWKAEREMSGFASKILMEDENTNISRHENENDPIIWTWSIEHDESKELKKLWYISRGKPQFIPARVEELAKNFRATGVAAASAIGFCLEKNPGSHKNDCQCFSWFGRPINKDDVKTAPPPERYKLGQLLSKAIDSGVPRCRWHRVRLEADIPTGTSISVAVSTSETKDPELLGDSNSDPQWSEFPAGLPHPDDWDEGPDNSTDFLIDQPPGRYLFVRLRLIGNGIETPSVLRIRLDFPRATSLDFLPGIYRENPEAEDFTERFLAIFDASVKDLDRKIERYPALLNIDKVHKDVLPWLAGFFDICLNSNWETEKKRKILSNIPELYHKRGTVSGLKKAIQLIFGVEPSLQEIALKRGWGMLGRDARLRSVSLFSRSRARFRLNSSEIGNAPIRSLGDPDADPLASHAHRFEILVPPGPQADSTKSDALNQLVAAQKPAHTLHSIRLGGKGFVLGAWSSVGIDTGSMPLQAPILSGQKGKIWVEGNVRLRSVSVLWQSRRGARRGLRVGETSTVGINWLLV